MDNEWDTSPMTGDQCALCEAPLDEKTHLIETEDGALLRVCGACALRSRSSRPPADARANTGDPADTEVATTCEALRRLASGKEEERALLERVAELLTALTTDLAYWQKQALHLESRIRTLEGELARTRERLQKTQEILAAPAAAASTPAEVPAPSAGRECATPHFPPRAPEVAVQEAAFSVEDIRAIQRLFNESPFTEKMRSVRRSLGRPIVNVAPVQSAGKSALVTVAWEIVWYQYLIEWGEAGESPGSATLFAEGMELTELSDGFKQPNAALDDQGRLDASEIEVSLLKEDQDTRLLSDMSAADEAALEDATEEVWDRHSLPEFKWDD
ncbi:MAG: hypothetical protein Kow00122_05110 [Thermoleophilia bacterium]